jgi:hypothetical protein
MFILKNLNIEAKRTGSIVILNFKKTKKSKLSLFLKTKGKKRKGSIVNYRSFAIAIVDVVDVAVLSRSSGCCGCWCFIQK